ncbi:hypothetical protein [Nesterenkonia marinintestina]|uniref:hypothetical protein n=1 Tax=Nesterenkonia marinintestina TaxID=2979865 RepID=UPI0021BF6D4D|nr:hypothetical protein [Nesterenkonia sp. GX14115]
MVSAQNTGAVERATARPWAQWLSLLDEAGAARMGHAAIAELALEHMPEDLRNPGWWAQGVAIGYEQERGLRVPGQGSDGTFKTSVSRTVAEGPEEARGAWIRLMEQAPDHQGVAVAGEPWTSDTEKRLYWRAKLDDGSKVSLSAEGKGEGRTLLTVTHEKLHGPEVIDGWKAHWKGVLGRL